MSNKSDAKDAAQFGLHSNPSANIEGTPLDNSATNKLANPRNVDLGDDDARHHEDEKMREAHRKIVESGGLTLADLGMVGPAARQMGSGLERTAEKVAQDLMHQGYNNATPDEAALLAESYGRQPTPPTGSWGAQKFMARIKGIQNPVPVWKVIDEDTGIEVPTVFRIQEPADRAASILNESGNLNDPRFKGLIKSYSEHVRLMRESRKLRRAIKEGRQNLRPKLQEVLGELEVANYKLGI